MCPKACETYPPYFYSWHYPERRSIVDAQAVAIASVTGRVLDAQNAVVPNVEIKCLSTETGVMHSAVTNNDGLYTLPSLPIGHYSLEATKQGFQTYVRKEITLQVNDNLQINITLTVGQVSERIEVNADTAAVQTQQSPAFRRLLMVEELRSCR